MICKIKSMQESGFSIRATSRVLGVSKNTVHKYFNQAQGEIDSYRSDYTRLSEFDVALSDIEQILSLHNDISATNLYRSIKQKYPDISAGIRAFRNYIRPIRLKYKDRHHRVYTPVFYTASECKVQADFGEYKMLNSVNISGKRTTKVYFLSFTFSYSTTRFVCYQTRHFNTNDTIRAHDEFFHFIGGVPKEIAYDQTKVVVIDEDFGEVKFNQKFDQFRQKCGFRPYVCAANSPESKGKVEQTVGYVQREFLKGRVFHDLETLQEESLTWLADVNSGKHSYQNKARDELFLEEKDHFTDASFSMQTEERRADKVGFISYLGNKYSVPYEYQRQLVLINSNSSFLFIYDHETHKQICKHNIPFGKGEVVYNAKHYPCKTEKLENLKTKANEALHEVDFANELINRLISDNPDIAHKQLRGLLGLATKYQLEHWNNIKISVLALPLIRYTLIKELLRVSQLKMAMMGIVAVGLVGNASSPIRYAPVQGVVANPTTPDAQQHELKPLSSIIDRDIKIYDRSIKNVIRN